MFLLSEAMGLLFTTAWTTVTTVTFPLPSLHLFTRWPEFLSSGARPFPSHPSKSRLIKHGCNSVIYFKSYVSVGGYACMQRPEVDIGGSLLITFHMINWGRLSWLSQELTNTAGFSSQLSLGIPVSCFLRVATTGRLLPPPAQNSYGFWISKLWSSCLCSKYFCHWVISPGHYFCHQTWRALFAFLFLRTCGHDEYKLKTTL